MASTATSKHGMVNIGTSLVLVVFIILTLFTFAALSAMAATWDYTASTASAAKVLGYYLATAQGEEKLAEIDSLLQASYQQEPAAYPANSLAAVEALGIAVTRDEEPILSYTIPMSDTQVLFVQLALHPPTAPSTSLYTRTVWQARAKESWKSDATLPLLQ